MSEQEGNQTKQEHLPLRQGQKDVSAHAHYQSRQEQVEIGRDRVGLDQDCEDEKQRKNRFHGQQSTSAFPLFEKEHPKKEDSRQDDNQDIRHCFPLCRARSFIEAREPSGQPGICSPLIIDSRGGPHPVVMPRPDNGFPGKDEQSFPYGIHELAHGGARQIGAANTADKQGIP